jgi:hypothetical protein
LVEIILSVVKVSITKEGTHGSLLCLHGLGSYNRWIKDFCTSIIVVLLLSHR